LLFRTIINQEPYLFEVFPERLKIKRDFTPFEVGEKVPKSFRRAFEQSVSSDESYKIIERRVLELTKRRRLNDLIADKMLNSSDEIEY
jgi:hypothetical protein